MNISSHLHRPLVSKIAARSASEKSRGAARDLSHGCAKRKRDSAQHQEKTVVFREKTT
jgi:hypothetical protein